MKIDTSLLTLRKRGRSCDGAELANAASVQLALRVEDVDRSIAEVKGNGVHFTGGVEEYAGTRWAHFSDPEGNQLEIKEIP